jgi:Zn-dependent M28 family amino/carboxypeptidase
VIHVEFLFMLNSIAVNELASKVAPERLRRTVEKLAAFPNRNTNSSTLLEAANWIADQFSSFGNLEVELMEYEIQESPRVPETKTVVQVIATLPGKSSRRVMVGAHFDSLNNSPGSDLNSRAPGANDDASGVALTLEVARLMSQQEWEHTLCFVCFSGEEQGLLGSKALAALAKTEDWQIDAFLSNDMVGNTQNNLGQHNDHEVRLFSDDASAHQSRELARWIEWTQRSVCPDFGVKLVLRADRFGRGGDHSPFNREGFTAVRFVEVHEEYSRQHTELDLPESIDFEYLANVTQVNLRAIANLANAGAPPSNVLVSRKQSYVTDLTWVGDANAEYMVYWRDTRSAIWENSRVVTGISATIEDVQKDDFIFAAGSVGGIPVEAT